ncbi:hypothetical protein HWV00_11020 [Moritella sp. 24]|uniref:hypothetical protein n=1 Tax=Moritella sp. 24 TaxID=2746230 RepID=UPI001BA8EC7A|nr:hypothetical protein [Moritella sp. 24]QUM76719.1 hypothetical protein HWV00_11020 [Moritella sp. 24]
MFILGAHQRVDNDDFIIIIKKITNVLNDIDYFWCINNKLSSVNEPRRTGFFGNASYMFETLQTLNINQLQKISNVLEPVNIKTLLDNVSKKYKATSTEGKHIVGYNLLLEVNNEIDKHNKNIQWQDQKIEMIRLREPPIMSAKLKQKKSSNFSNKNTTIDLVKEQVKKNIWL